MWNSNSEEKNKINLMDELRRVVGEKADEVICDCSNWVKEYCPLDSWLKEQQFRNKSIADAINSRSNTIDVEKWTWLVCEYWNGEKQKRISKVNTENRLKQTETPTNGARSTTRIFHDLINMPPTQLTQEIDESSEPHETQQDPLYITLFEKTKKHEGSGWEPNVEKDYEALKRLHKKEVEKHGDDKLSVTDAYMEVLKQKSGYVKGLGPGARPPKKFRAEGESNEARVSLSLEIQKLKDDASAREASLASEIETLKASNDELKTSNEELIVSNDELKATVSRFNIEAIKREKKLRDDMMKMLEQMRYDAFSSSFYKHIRFT
ncbi:Fibronectin-binding protein PlpA [Bienertia sinuspersici]